MRYAELINRLGGDVEVVSEVAGDAATRKLLRSVFVKGMTGVLVEALHAADAAGQGAWFREHVTAVVESADAALLRRLVAGTAIHAGRRIEEMSHAATLLRQLGVEPLLTEAAVARLRAVADEGVPEFDPGGT